MWLVLVAGGAKEYSYDIDDPIKIDKFNSGFEKIFLLSDFENELYNLI